MLEEMPAELKPLQPTLAKKIMILLGFVGTLFFFVYAVYATFVQVGIIKY